MTFAKGKILDNNFGGDNFNNRSTSAWGRTGFYPKRIVKSFRDLEVYQKTFKNSVDVMKKIVPELKDGMLRDKIIETSLMIPNLIAEAHSRRFDDKELAHKLLEESMAACNKNIVFIEQARDIHNINGVMCEEIIKSYGYMRQKILNLQRAWKSFEKKK